VRRGAGVNAHAVEKGGPREIKKCQGTLTLWNVAVERHGKQKSGQEKGGQNKKKKKKKKEEKEKQKKKKEEKKKFPLGEPGRKPAWGRRWGKKKNKRKNHNGDRGKRKDKEPGDNSVGKNEKPASGKEDPGKRKNCLTECKKHRAYVGGVKKVGGRWEKTKSLGKTDGEHSRGKERRRL